MSVMRACSESMRRRAGGATVLGRHRAMKRKLVSIVIAGGAGVVGLLGGQFHHPHDASYLGDTCEQVMERWAKKLDLPCVIRLPFSHTEDSMGLINGRKLELQTHADGRWSITWAKAKAMG